jgi:hypothetical protein
MVLAGMLILGVSAFIIPHLNPSLFNGSMNFNNTSHPIPINNIPGFVAGILTGVGLFGLICGIIVLGSGVMVRIHPEQSTVFGVLILIFSVLSFFGSGGFVVGAILGIIGGVMILRWRRPATVAGAPSSVPVA